MANPFGPKVTDALLWVAMPVGSPERRKRFYELCDKWGDKVFYAALDRLNRRGYIEYGVSIRGSWLTKKGKEVLARITS